MERGLRYFSVLIALSIFAHAFAPVAARAGGGMVEGLPDNPEDGPPFFGEAIDVKGHKRMVGVHVRADFGKSQYLLTTTDEEGDFHFTGFGKNVDPASVRISCSKEGYRLIDASRQPSSGASDAPIHIECLMERE